MILVVDQSGHLRWFESKISAIVHINGLLRTGLDCTVFAGTCEPPPEPETTTVTATNASYEARIEALEKQTEANRESICRNADVSQGLLDVFHAQQKKLAATVEAIEGRVSQLEALREMRAADVCACSLGGWAKVAGKEFCTACGKERKI